MLSLEESRMVESAVAEYILIQRERYGADSKVLPGKILSRMKPYFRAADLERVRVRHAHPERVPNPDFYRLLRASGLEGLPDFPGVAAITFDHVIVFQEPLSAELVFHELVHTVQFRLLGIEAFAKSYVQGFLFEGRYDSIPLEVCAFALEDRFRAGSCRLDVETEVRHWVRMGKFG